MATRLIGLNGRLHSGKDTIYEMIAELAESPKRVAFADKLKLSAARALGFRPESVEEAVDLCNWMKEDAWITISTRDDDAWCSWFAGFVDGEACFRVTNKGVPEFQIGLRSDDRALLEDIKGVLGVGYLYEYDRKGLGNPITQYRVCGAKDCMAVRGALGDRLRSKKIRDYKLWCDAVDARAEGASYKEMQPHKEAIAAVRKFDSGVIVPSPPFLRRTITGRDYLQAYGTESHRNVFGQDFWVDALLPPWDGMAYTASAFWPEADVVVITDVRFPNEAERILEHGGEVWWIDAEERLGRLPYDAHVSEQPLDPQLITAVLDNNGSLNRLREGVETLYELL